MKISIFLAVLFLRVMLLSQTTQYVGIIGDGLVQVNSEIFILIILFVRYYLF
jgi:hypothetical protein